MSKHPTIAELAAFLEAFTREGSLGLLTHLLECGGCRRVALSQLKQQPGAGRLAKVLPYERTFDYGGLVARFEHAYDEALDAGAAELASGAEAVEELLGQPAGRWEVLLLNQESFRTWSFAAALLERSLTESLSDPRRGEELAQLALSAARRLDVATYGRRLLEDLEGRSWATIGNCRRLAGSFVEADQAFATAAEHLADVIDPVERARYVHQLALLRRDQRRFLESLELLEEAAEIYREVADREKEAHALSSLGLMWVEHGSPAQAVEPLEAALSIVDSLPAGSAPRLVLSVRHNLAQCMAELGNFMEAQRIFAQCRRGYSELRDAKTQLHARWLEGTIALGTGHLPLAESLLDEVRVGYGDLGLPYHSALASLSLAEVYAEQGRTLDLLGLCEGLVAVFHSLEARDEMLTALGFFRQAARQEQATAELVRWVTAFVKRASMDATARFEPPSDLTATLSLP